MPGVELATAYVSIVMSAKGARKGVQDELRGVESDAGAAGKSAGGALGGAMSGGLASAMSGLGSKAKVLIGGAFAGGALMAGKALYGIGSTFDDVTDTIRVGTGATGDALDALVGSAKNIGSQVPNSFEEVGSTVADLNTRLGLTGPTLETVAKQFLEVGNITGQKLNVQGVTAALSAFGVQGKDTAGAMDTLYRVSQSTGVGMNELAGSVQKGAPALKQFGLSFGESTALMGAFDKAGLDSGKATMALTKALGSFAKEGKNAPKALQDTITQIGNFTKAGKDADALKLAGKLFGTKGAAQFVDAVKSGKLNLDQLAAAAKGSGDTILGAAEDTKDFAEKWDTFKNQVLVALEPLATRVFNGMAQAMDVLGPKALDAINALTGISTWVQENSAVMVPVGIALGVVATALGALAVAAGVASVATGIWATITAGATAVAGAFSAVMAILTSPIFLVVAAIAAAIAIGVLLYKNWDAIKAKASEVWSAVTGTVSSAWNAIKGAVSGALAAVWTAISMKWQEIKVRTTFMWAQVEYAIKIAWQRIKDAVSGAVANVRTAVSNAWENVKSKTSSAWNAVTGFISTAWGRIVSAVTNGMGNAKANVARGWEAVRSGTLRAWDGIRNGVTNGVNRVIQAVRGLPDTIRNVFAGAGSWLWNAGWSIINGLLNGINSMIGRVRDKLGELTNMIPQWKGPPRRDGLLLRDAGRLIVGGLVDGFDDEAGDARSYLQGLTSDLSADLNVSAVGAPRRRTAAMSTPASPTVNVNVYNPVAEPTSRTVNRAMSRVALIGQLGGA